MLGLHAASASTITDFSKKPELLGIKWLLFQFGALTSSSFFFNLKALQKKERQTLWNNRGVHTYKKGIEL